MVKLFSKTQPLHVDADAPAIDITMRNLEAHRLACVLEIKALERKHVKRVPLTDGETLEERAAGYLGEAPRPRSGKTLAELDRDLAALDLALETARRRSAIEHVALAERLALQAQPEWREIVRRRALAIVALQKSNREAEQFTQELAVRSGHRIGLTLAWPAGRLLGLQGQSNSNGSIFVQAALEAGFVTTEEIRNA